MLTAPPFSLAGSKAGKLLEIWFVLHALFLPKVILDTGRKHRLERTKEEREKGFSKYEHGPKNLSRDFVLLFLFKYFWLPRCGCDLIFFYNSFNLQASHKCAWLKINLKN